MKDIFDAKGLCFSGFVDIWGEDGYLGSAGDKFVFLSEPQFWYNIGHKYLINAVNISFLVRKSGLV